MIARVHGQLIGARPPEVVIDVAGIGYELNLPIPDCASLGNIGGTVILYTHLVVREDAHSLYGFLNIDNRDCFRTLIKVSGIGPRIALALLSTLTPDELNIALEQADVTTLCRTPGIGKKMAERMILELKGKLHIESVITNEAPIRIDIANALTSLGYNDKEITRIIKQLPPEINDLSFGIKEALKLLNK
jgi:Holliday junction DNA helicase RuvA